jgi:hypothetical protein
VLFSVDALGSGESALHWRKGIVVGKYSSSGKQNNTEDKSIL